MMKEDQWIDQDQTTDPGKKMDQDQEEVDVIHIVSHHPAEKVQ